MLAFIRTIDLALYLYWWIIIASAIFSWLYAFNVVNPRNQFVGSVGNMLFRLTEPALRPIRRYMPDLGGIDISPIVLLLIIYFIRQLLWTTIAPAPLSCARRTASETGRSAGTAMTRRSMGRALSSGSRRRIFALTMEAVAPDHRNEAMTTASR